jgi:hypothetical protein
MTPEERALRNMDNEQFVPQQDKQGLDDLQKAANSTQINKPISLGKVESRDYTKESTESTNLKYGYFNLNILDFPSQGKFYPNGTTIRIKAATVKDIRTFSALDENNPYEVDEALVELLSNCVRVSFNSNKVGSWKDILEEDRLYLILSIRELTFAEGENRVSFKVKCESCGTDNDMEIINENFQKRQIHEKILQYYSPEDKRFNIETKSYGTINMKPPSMGIMRIVSKYIKTLQENKENVKDYLPFLKTLPYMIEEWRGLTIESINNYRMEFMRWDSNKFLTYNKLVQLAQISVMEKMMKPCSKCQDPIEAKIELPTGIKGLFIEDNILDNELM